MTLPGEEEVKKKAQYLFGKYTTEKTNKRQLILLQFNYYSKVLGVLSHA